MRYPAPMNTRMAWVAGLALGWGAAAGAAAYEDRFVWVYGWRLRTDAEVGEVSRIIETAAKHGCNGAVMEAGLDTLTSPASSALRTRTSRTAAAHRCDSRTSRPIRTATAARCRKCACPPRRCLRATFFVRAEGLEPAGALRVMAMAGPRTLAEESNRAPGTFDWRKMSILLNTPDDGLVKLYAGVWGGKAGRVWIDDLTVEEVGPLNVLRRPGTPVTVRSEDGSVTYAEGRDYAPLEDPAFDRGRIDRPPPPLRLLSGGAIPDGARLRVSWYYTAPVQNGQVSVCMAEPALDEIFDHEAKLLAERVRPRKALLAVDEVRMGGTCRACAGRDMGEVLGGCVTRQIEALRRHIPGIAVYAWSDMFDPDHNAHGDYYIVRGFMYTPWRKSYDLLPAFGDLLGGDTGVR